MCFWSDPGGDAEGPSPKDRARPLSRLRRGFAAATGEEAGVAVAAVTGLLAGRLDLRWGEGAARIARQELADVAPVLRRGATRTGEAGTVAVLEPGEGADGVGVKRAEAPTARRLAVAVNLTRGGGTGGKDQGRAGGRRADHDGADTHGLPFHSVPRSPP